jgi:N-formylglutamate amidohydrolase
LTESVEQKLNKHNFAIIIDCHSFANTPFETDLDKSPNRPDICLGVDEFHTPKWLVEQIKHRFKQHGLSVNINSPYSGTIVPTKFFQKDGRVRSIMIEINRKLYMKENMVIAEEVSKLNQIIQEIFINN